MHVYVLEHAKGNSSRTTPWILTTLGRDEVLIDNYKCCCFFFFLSARSTQVWIIGGTKIGRRGSLLS